MRSAYRGCVLSFALGVGLFLVGCGGPGGAGRPEPYSDPYFTRVMTSGHAAFERGDIARAAELYQRARVRAERADRDDWLLASAYNAALAHHLLGDSARAREGLSTAQTAALALDDPAVDVRLLFAELEWNDQRVDAAWALLEGLMDASLTRPHRVQVHSLRALIALDTGDVEQARQEIAAAEHQLRRSTAWRLRARVAEVNGRIAWREEASAQAAAHFDDEAYYYQQDGRFEDRARAQLRAAEAHLAADDPMTAVDRYLRAARHFAAGDEQVLALQSARSALTGLERVEDEAWRSAQIERVLQLKEKLKQVPVPDV